MAFLTVEAGVQHSQSPAIACGAQRDENSLHPGFLIRRSILLAPLVFGGLRVVEEEVSARRGAS